MKIAVLGAGISGLSIAQMLRAKHEVTLLERKPHAGGLIKCERIHDCLYHKVGGHVFNAKNEQVLNWFWSFFDREKEFTQAKRNAKVFYQNKIIGYPIENYIYNLDKILVERITKELLHLQLKTPKTAFEYANFELFLKGNFGETLYNIYFRPYNTKIWKTDLEQVSMEWLEGKLPMPDYEDIILSNILREEETEMVHASFFYPKYNGSQFIVDRLLKNINIEVNFDLSKAGWKNEQVVLNETLFDRVIYTGDIRKLPMAWQDLLASKGIDLLALNALHSNGTSTLFCETDDTDISWLYIPENFTKAHRIIYTGNFSDTNSQGSNRKTCVIEFSGKMDYDEMVSEAQLLPGNLSPLSHNYEPNSYVVQTHATRELVASAKEVLEAHGIYLLGRFAEWEYYNMDKCIEAAIKLSERLE